MTETQTIAAKIAGVKCGTKDLTEVQKEIKKYMHKVEKIMTKPLPSAKQVADETSITNAMYHKLEADFAKLEALQNDVIKSYDSLIKINKLASDLDREVDEEVARLSTEFFPKKAYILVEGTPALTSDDLEFICKSLNSVDGSADGEVVFPVPAELL
jgi:hypothetical protein